MTWDQIDVQYDRYKSWLAPICGIEIEDYCKDINKLVVKKSTIEEKNMNKKIYSVKFVNYYKTYFYYSNVPLTVGATYEIVADGKKKYETPVIVLDDKVDSKVIYGVNNIRTITSAKLISNVKRPEDGIKKVIFDEAKDTTCVLWMDGTKTIVRCQDGDEFDKEKALALCYMKKKLGNRGSFNETLKRYCN